MAAAQRGRDGGVSEKPRKTGFSEVHRKRRARNIALLVALVAWVVLFYVITIVKMGGGS